MYGGCVASGLYVENAAVAKMGDWPIPRSLANRSCVASCERRGMAVGIARMRETRRKKRKEKIKREEDLLCSLTGFKFGVGGWVGATLNVG